MKHWLMLIALICFGSQVMAQYVVADGPPIPVAAEVTQPVEVHYFRPFYRHPVFVGGALLDVNNINNTEATSMMPLITHSPADGCLLPAIVCEDWTPIAVGVAMNAGKMTFDVAPLANVLPWMQRGLLAITPESYVGVRNILSSQRSSVTFSAGPVWEYRQASNKGYFRIFTGLALSF